MFTSDGCLQVMDVYKRPLFFLHMFGCCLGLGHRRKLPHSLLLAYCLMIGLLHVASVVRIVFCLRDVSMDARTGIVYVVHLALSHGMASTVFAVENLFSHRNLVKTITALEHYQTTHGFLWDNSRSEKVARALCLVACLFSFVHSMMWPTVYLLVSESYSFYTYPFTRDYSWLGSAVWSYSMAAVSFITMTPVVLIFLLYSTITEMIVKEFQCLAEQTRRLVEDKVSKDIDDRLVQVRDRHQSLRQATQALSCLVRQFVALTLLFNMGYLLYTIYTVGHAMPVDYLVSSGSTTTCLVLSTICIPMFWGRLPTAAHQFCEVVANCPWTGKSTETLHKIGLIITQDSNSKIGIDMYGLFVLDISTLVMITSLVTTYGMVVLQFGTGRVGSTSPLDTCRNTSLIML